MGRRKLCGIASVFLCKVSTYKEPFGGTLLVWYWGPPLYSRESQLTKVSLAQDTSYEIDTKVACCVYEVSENKNCILVHLERERPCQIGDSLSHHMNICDAMPIKIEVLENDSNSVIKGKHMKIHSEWLPIKGSRCLSFRDSRVKGVGTFLGQPRPTQLLRH
jgi:hypothetical protein